MAHCYADGSEDQVDQGEDKEDDESISCRCVVLADKEEHDGDVGEKAEEMQGKSQPKGQLFTLEKLKRCGKDQRKGEDLC